MTLTHSPPRYHGRAGATKLCRLIRTIPGWRQTATPASDGAPGFLDLVGLFVLRSADVAHDIPLLYELTLPNISVYWQRKSILIGQLASQ